MLSNLSWDVPLTQRLCLRPSNLSNTFDLYSDGQILYLLIKKSLSFQNNKTIVKHKIKYHEIITQIQSAKNLYNINIITKNISILYKVILIKSIP